MPAAGLRAPLFDDDRDIRGAQMGPAEIVRREFSHLKIQDIVIEHYDQVGVDVVYTIIARDQIELLGEGHGEHLRRAARKSGMSVEVILEDTWRRDHVTPPARPDEPPTDSN
jgi:hypothetical protein